MKIVMKKIMKKKSDKKGKKNKYLMKKIKPNNLYALNHLLYFGKSWREKG